MRRQTAIAVRMLDVPNAYIVDADLRKADISSYTGACTSDAGLCKPAIILSRNVQREEGR